MTGFVSALIGYGDTPLSLRDCKYFFSSIRLGEIFTGRYIQSVSVVFSGFLTRYGFLEAFNVKHGERFLPRFGLDCCTLARRQPQFDSIRAGGALLLGGRG